MTKIFYYIIWIVSSLCCSAFWFMMYGNKHGYHMNVDIPFSIALGFLSGVVIMLLATLLEAPVNSVIEWIKFNRLKGIKENGNRFSGVMNAAEWYKCDNCGEKISKEDLDRYWDWSGPHCPHCGYGGMSMFGSVVEQDCPDGIQNMRGSIYRKMKRFLGEND